MKKFENESIINFNHVEIIEQLKDEVETNKHDITIIGGGGNKGIHQKNLSIVQFLLSKIIQLIKSIKYSCR